MIVYIVESAGTELLKTVEKQWAHAYAIGLVVPGRIIERTSDGKEATIWEKKR